MNDMSVVRVYRCGITRGTLSDQHVLIFIWMIMTDYSFKIVSNWTVLTLRALAGQAEGFGRHAIGGLHGDVYHVTTLQGTNAHRSSTV